ncbi:MAG: OmpH family outer membrane protein, partial [Spirochaetaceae bacterium]
LCNNRRNRVKKLIIAILLLLAVASTATAAQLTMVAVIDLTRIVEDYFQESGAWREIENLREKTEENIEERKDEITKLKEKRLEAMDEDDEQLELSLEEEIRKQEEYLKEYNRIMSERINSRRENLLSSSDFSREILKAVQYVAESEGYSIVLRKKEPNILHYNQEVDITEKVLRRLRETSSN